MQPNPTESAVQKLNSPSQQADLLPEPKPQAQPQPRRRIGEIIGAEVARQEAAQREREYEAATAVAFDNDAPLPNSSRGTGLPPSDESRFAKRVSLLIAERQRG